MTTYGNHHLTHLI